MCNAQFLPNVMRASEWSFMYLRSRGPLLCPMWGPLLCQTSVWASQCYAICVTRCEIHSAKVGVTVGGRHHRQAACYQPSWCHILRESTIFITINSKLYAVSLWQVLKILEQRFFSRVILGIVAFLVCPKGFPHVLQEIRIPAHSGVYIRFHCTIFHKRAMPKVDSCQ